MARAAAHEPARSGPRGRDLDAPPELPRDRAHAAEPRDGLAALACARGAAARPQRAAYRGRLRTGLSRDRAGRARDGPGEASARLHASPARAVSRDGARPPLEHPLDQRRDGQGDGALPRPRGHGGARSGERDAPVLSSAGAAALHRQLEATAAAFIQWLHRDLLRTGDVETRRLLDELLSYPDVPKQWQLLDLDASTAPFLAIELKKADVRFGFFTLLASLGTPYDITLHELRIECFFAADAATDAALRRL